MLIAFGLKNFFKKKNEVSC